jgi:hypothetical protein
MSPQGRGGVRGPLARGRRCGPIGAQFLSECALHQPRLVAGRRVVGVDEGGPEVAVAHPLCRVRIGTSAAAIRVRDEAPTGVVGG